MANSKPYPVHLLTCVSYSGLMALHSCPRKFMLTRAIGRDLLAGDDIDMSGVAVSADDMDSDDAEKVAKATAKARVQSVTFAYGHAVGIGVQEILKGKSDEEVMWEMFLGWDTYYDSVDEKSGKCFTGALLAVEKFRELRTIDFDVDDWELVKVPGTDRWATELSFVIHLPDGAKYIGFVDAVLRNKFSGEYAVLECKTTGKRFVTAGMYSNSNQAVGYAVVLDKVFGALSSYSVIYTPYLVACDKWEVFTFPKTPMHRAGWIMNVVADVNAIKGYIAAGHFPTYGESCVSWNRDCKFLGNCTHDLSMFYLEDDRDTRPDSMFDVVISMDELIAAQLEKNENGTNV